MEIIGFNAVMLLIWWVFYSLFIKKDEYEGSTKSKTKQSANTYRTTPLSSKPLVSNTPKPKIKPNTKPEKPTHSSFEDLYIRSQFDTSKIPVVDEPEKPIFEEGYFDSLLSDEEYGVSKSSYQSQNLPTHVRSKRFKRGITNTQIAALGIRRLYHFTDKRNLNSIKQNGGLYSWDWLERNNVVIPAQGGGRLSKNLDKKKGLENYVRLSFVQDHPMMYAAQRDGRINESALLEIDPQVILFEGALYSNMNATDSNATIGGSYTDLRSIDLNLIKSGEWSGEAQKKRFQAEVLVPEHIPLKYIKGL